VLSVTDGRTDRISVAYTTLAHNAFGSKSLITYSGFATPPLITEPSMGAKLWYKSRVRAVLIIHLSRACLFIDESESATPAITTTVCFLVCPFYTVNTVCIAFFFQPT